MTAERPTVPHPVWIRPRSDELALIKGDCGVQPIGEIDVRVERVDVLDDPTIHALMLCKKFPSGNTLVIPFPLMDAAETNVEQTFLGIDTVSVSVSSLCKVCEFRDQKLGMSIELIP